MIPDEYKEGLLTEFVSKLPNSARDQTLYKNWNSFAAKEIKERKVSL